MNSAEYMDAVRERHGLTSDNKLAAFLGVDRANISSYRTRSREFPAHICAKVAAALDLPPGVVIAEIQAERAKRTDEKTLWREMADSLRKVAALTVAVVAVFSFAPGESQAAVNKSGQEYTLYAYRRRLRRLLGRFLAGFERVCYPLLIILALFPLLALSGCAASPTEKAWQAMHLVDTAQTLNGVTHGCRLEAAPITREVIGSTPTDSQVIAWSLAVGLLHYQADRWLTRNGHDGKTWAKVLRGIDLGYQAGVIVANHHIGMRPFGENAGCPPDPGLRQLPVPVRF